MSKTKSRNALFISAYAINLVSKFAITALGTISTLILVRYLSPNDFGIVAIGFLILGFFNVLSESGVKRYLILHSNPKKEDYDSAWTLQLMLRSSVIFILLLSSYFISLKLEKPDLAVVLIFLCINEFIVQFYNIGTVKLEKKIDYNKTNQIAVLAKVISAIVTIICAVTFQNYYALVIGTIINGAFSTCLSYILVDYRPSFNFKIKKEMFSFSYKMFIRNIISFTRSQLDLLLITKLFGDTGAGNFSVAKRFAIMPMGEVLQPAMGPIFSYLSQLKEQPSELEAKTYQAIFFIYMILTPFFVGLMAISESFTAVVLGEKWMSLSEYIGLLGFLMFPFAVQPIFLILYDAANKIFLSMIIDLVSIVLLVVGYITFDIVDIYTFVVLRIGVGAITLTLSYLMICKILPINIIKLLIATILPCLLSSSIIVGLVSLPINSHSIYIQFGLEVIIGACFYLTANLLVFWILVKACPTSFVARLLPIQVHQLLQKSLNSH